MTGIGFQPIDNLTLAVFAQRVRVAAAFGLPIDLSMSPDAARSLVSEIDRLVAGAERAEAYLAGEVRRIETEAGEAATRAAMAHMADQLTAMSQAAEAQYEAAKASVGRAFVVLSLTIIVALTIWGWF